MNNGKNHLWIKFLSGISIVLLGFAVGYGMLNKSVETNTTRIDKVEKQSGDTHDRVIKIEVNVQHIVEKVERMADAIDRIEKKI